MKSDQIIYFLITFTTSLLKDKSGLQSPRLQVALHQKEHIFMSINMTCFELHPHLILVTCVKGTTTDLDKTTVS